MILVLKCLVVRLRFAKKLLVFGRLRVERTVLKGFADRMPLLKEVERGRREEGFGQALVDVANSLLGRVEHVFLIEAVVTELIVDDLIRRKIGNRWVITRLDDQVDSQQ